jgi:hypothetical protein
LVLKIFSVKYITICLFLVLLVVILNCVSCGGRRFYDVDRLELPEAGVSVTDDNRLFGEWQACGIKRGGYSMNMNICPTIVFRAAGAGFVRSPSGTIEGFTWKLRSGKLSIVRSSDIPDPVFADTIYSVVIKYDKRHYNAVLESRSANETFYLGR